MRRFWVASGLVVLIGCAGSGGSGQPGSGEPTADASVTPGPTCEGDGTRCSGPSYEQCLDGHWTQVDRCDTFCDVTLGCTECSPGFDSCSGNDVVACTNEGKLGEIVKSCPQGCAGGKCATNCDADGVDKVYTVTDSNEFLRFDPQALPASGSADAAFSLVGNLDCPAGDAWPEQSGGIPLPSNPFSMSVDRNGMAWVLYTSGEIFQVSIEDASCQTTNFAKGQNGFQLFGMGFSSDKSGAADETLFIAGGVASQDQVGDLGTISDGLAVTRVADLPTSEYGPELSGNGKAELWAYFPFPGGGEKAFIGKMNKATAQIEQKLVMDNPESTPQGWAFAFWGGKFYVFITYGDLLGYTSYVKVVDPMTPGTVKTYSTTKLIVGAGVSTCAPTEGID